MRLRRAFWLSVMIALVGISLLAWQWYGVTIPPEWRSFSGGVFCGSAITCYIMATFYLAALGGKEH